MISSIQQIPPQIDFGFGKTTLSASAHTPVTVWLNTLYNTAAYTFTLVTPNGTVQKQSDFEYVITPTLPGTYSISLMVTHKATGIRLDSNILTLTIH